MPESTKCVLEVYDAPTYSLSVDEHYKGGSIGDDVTFTVRVVAVGNWQDSVTIALTGLPTGASVSYDPNPPTLSAGDSAVITVDTDNCSAGTTRMTIAEAA